MYVYKSHLGGWWANNRLIPDDELYCETCCDYDMLVGYYDSFKEFLKCNANDIAVDDDGGGYDLQYVIDEISYVFDDKLTFDEAKAIVKANKTYEEED